MRVLNKSRRRLHPGDVFTFQMPDDLFRYGRVITTDAFIGGFPNCVLIYLYAESSRDKSDIPRLQKNDLLIAPLGTNRLAWIRGYFEFVANVPLTADDVWPVHCFWDDPFQRYVDEHGNKLPHRFEPCGFDGLNSFLTIDYQISAALGITQSKEWER